MHELEVLSEQVAQCVLCPELSGQRTQTVFGHGNDHAQIMIIGEAPGEEEDKQGRPFVGRAGRLLTNILAAVGVNRDDVYIANVLKCRPPRNRVPTLEEAANCRPFLENQIRLISPKFIICLGATASQHLLKTNATITALRGQWHEYDGRKVLCTYHPSYLLRTGEKAKQAVWDDLQLLTQELHKCQQP